jgi:hypothetical protein
MYEITHLRHLINTDQKETNLLKDDTQTHIIIQKMKDDTQTHIVIQKMKDSRV